MPSNPTQWDVARTAKTMAVVTTVSIDPTKITTRIKNKLTRWLHDGHLEGGHQSHARRLGDLLADKFRLPTTHLTWRGLYVQHDSVNDDAKRKILELLEADWIAFILENPHYNNRGHHNWYRQHYDNAVNAIKCGDRAFLDIHNPQYRKDIIQIMSASITTDQRDRINKAIAAINGTEVIHCFSYGD
jgi:hypothetical protein